MNDRQKCELLVVGGSAGSLSVVLKIVPLLALPMNLAVVLVFHRKQSDDTTLLDVLKARTRFRVKEAEDKDEIEPGTIYLAPADYHLLIEKNHFLTLDDSEKINFSRPSIDVTFESAAEAYGKALVCILLSGANADGVDGLIKARNDGALIVVQDPAWAEVAYMPREAVARVPIDILLTPENFSTFINDL